jgi:hypothetical protein
MQSLAREDEATPDAACGFHHQALTPRSHGPFHVPEVFLESPHRHSKLTAQIIEAPLLLTQGLDNLLPAGAIG